MLGNVRKPWMLLKTLLTEMCATLRENDAIRRHKRSRRGERTFVVPCGTGLTIADEFFNFIPGLRNLGRTIGLDSYSGRRASVGSTLAARNAGTQPARRAAATRTSVAVANVKGSVGFNPKSKPRATPVIDAAAIDLKTIQTGHYPDVRGLGGFGKISKQVAIAQESAAVMVGDSGWIERHAAARVQ